MLKHTGIFQRYFLCFAGVLFSVLLLTAIVSLALGPVDIPLRQIFHWLAGDGDESSAIILGQVRLPRIMMAIAVGAILASCGAATQGLFRNPLADPSLIGVSAGASAGASIAIVAMDGISIPWLMTSVTTASALLGGLLVVLLVYRLSMQKYGVSVATLLLAGLAFTFLAGCITSILELIADSVMLRRLSLWRMGGLDGATLQQAMTMMLVAIAIFIGLFRQRQALNALLLGESEAQHLGFAIQSVKKQIIFLVAVGVGVTVAWCGIIAFVGLLIPHIARMVVGPNHRWLLPISALSGAMLLLLSDTVARTVIAPAEIPVGLITIVIGAPFFIVLLRHTKYYQ